MESTENPAWGDDAHACEAGQAHWPAFEQTEPHPNDHFVKRDGLEFAGTHLIVDFRDARPLDDLAIMEATLRQAVEDAQATLLHIHLHHFTPNGGISGVAVLAESHISVHTWPERDYAAFDVFMCGDADPRAAVATLESAFRPGRIEISEHLRGLTQAADPAT